MQSKLSVEGVSSPSVLPSSPEAFTILRENAPRFSPSALPSRPGRPRKSDALEEDTKGYPVLSIVVVGTTNGSGREYRVGVVKWSDFVEGLRLDDGTLNAQVARRCFGHSKVYTVEKAEDAARAMYDATVEEFRLSSMGVRAQRRVEKPLSRQTDDNIEDQALTEAHKRVCGIKVLHLNCPWPH